MQGACTVRAGTSGASGASDDTATVEGGRREAGGDPDTPCLGVGSPDVLACCCRCRGTTRSRGAKTGDSVVSWIGSCRACTILAGCFLRLQVLKLREYGPLA